MRVLFFAAGPEILASSRTRVYQYIPYLERERVETKVITYTSESHCRKNIGLANDGLFGKAMDKIFAWRQTLAVIMLARNYHILFIQKVLLPQAVTRFLKKLNPNIVFDFDDALYLADKYEEPHRPTGDNFLNRFNYILRSAKAIVVENHQNKSYARKFNPNITIITGPIDTARYFPKPRSEASAIHGDTVAIGWIGSPGTTMYLAPLIPVFKRLSARYRKLKVILIGSGEFQVESVDIERKKWNLDNEAGDLQTFDIGIMPLEDDEWSRGKGGYKLLQYMATGIPCIASPVGINAEIVQEGMTGYLARTEEEWFDKLARLVEDRALRERMGQSGRIRAESIFSYNVNAPRLVEIFKDCIGVGRGDGA